MELISNNASTLWRDALNLIIADGVDIGSRDGACREALGVTLVLTDVQRNFVLDHGRKLSPVYAAAELLWYLSGDDNIGMIKSYAPQYERFAENGIAYGAYGARLKSTHQFDRLFQLLRDKPYTRQAVLSLWRPGDLLAAVAGEHKDLPCTLSAQFLVRHGHLHCFVTMRSNDIWLGTPYDMFCWSCIQMMVADTLGLQYGTYTHQVSSLHLYDRDLEKVKAARAVDRILGVDFSKHHDSFGAYKEVNNVLAFEKAHRLQKGDGPHNLIDCVMFDLGMSAGSKWTPDLREEVQSPLLRRAFEIWKP